MKKNNCRFFLFWNSNFADISISLSYILYILKPLF
jgi:hypothetical protein